MLSKGFYLADVSQIQSRLRMSKDCFADFCKRGGQERFLHRWPTAFECRYVKNIDIEDGSHTLSSILKSWLISFCVHDCTYCLHLIEVIRTRSDVYAGLTEELLSLVHARISERSARAKRRAFFDRIVSKIERTLRL